MISVAVVCVAVAGLGLPIAKRFHASQPSVSQPALLGNTLLWSALLAGLFFPVFAVVHGWIARAFADGRGGLV